MSKFIKIATVAITSIVVAIVGLILVLYLAVIPAVIKNPSFLDYVKNLVWENCGAELIVSNPCLKTSLRPEISFKTDTMSLTKDGEMLLNLENFDSEVSFAKIFSKKIILKKLGADDIFVDVNKLQKLSIKQSDKEQKPSDIKLDWLSALLYVKKCAIIYNTDKNVMIKLLAKDLEITESREPKFIHFGVFLDFYYDKQHLKLFFKDRDNVYIKDKKLIFDNFKFLINHSEVTVKADMSEKHSDLEFFCDKFEMKNIVQIMDTNLLIPNGKEIMSCFKDMDGYFNFKLKLCEEDLSGTIKISKITTKLKPLADMPLTVTKGLISINPKNIEMKDFEGYYGASEKQEIKMNGIFKDYMKTAKSELLITGTAYDEFTRYISKLAGIRIQIVKEAKVALKVAFDATGKVDVTGGGKIPVGSDVLFEGTSISPDKFDRAIGVKLSVLRDALTINHINYYIADSIAENVKPNRPLITISGNLNAYTGVIKDLAFDIPEPLPSEFFNVLAGQRIFKKGTIFGKMKFVNSKVPYIDGNVVMMSVRLAGQRTRINNAVISSDNEHIHIKSDGRLRRMDYNFDGVIENRIVFPIVIQKVDFSVDELDVEKVMKSFAPRTPRPAGQAPRRASTVETATSDVPLKYFEVEDKKPAEKSADEETESDGMAFEPNLLIVKNCHFNVKKGAYKLIKFGNLHANLTLTKDGVLEIKSNKFDFADGISTLKVYCDLAKQNYSVRLGAKDVDTDAIATSVLNLGKEISGKASALLEFYTDDKMKLNGKIQFAIKDGSITKLGLVQYVLNFASLFRNPVAMISPSTLLDLVDVPDGTFKSINGTLMIRNNIVERMMIKSSSPQLSSFIIGRINLENMDSSLRIYTKFSNKKSGIAGFLRGISLNALAKKVNNPKNNVSYYAAELSQLPELETGEETAQVFLTKFDGDVQSANFISSLKKIK